MLTRATGVAINEIDACRCIGCGVCVQSCQNDVIRMRRGKAYTAYPEDCSGCTCCIEDCPREAISLGSVATNDSSRAGGAAQEPQRRP